VEEGETGAAEEGTSIAVGMGAGKPVGWGGCCARPLLLVKGWTAKGSNDPRTGCDIVGRSANAMRVAKAGTVALSTSCSDCYHFLISIVIAA